MLMSEIGSRRWLFFDILVQIERLLIQTLRWNYENVLADFGRTVFVNVVHRVVFVASMF